MRRALYQENTQAPRTFSTLRRHRAARLYDYVRHRGGKIYLTPDHVRGLERVGLPPYAAESAAESLRTAGVIDLRLVGETPVIELFVTTDVGHNGEASWR